MTLLGRCDSGYKTLMSRLACVVYCLSVQIVQCDGNALLPYQEELISVLRLTLGLKCKEAADLAGVLLKNLLKAVTFTFTLDYRNTPTDWNLPFSQQLPIRVSDWIHGV